MGIKIKIGSGFYKSASLPISNQECVNLYPSVPQTQGALTDENLFATPGITEKIANVIYKEFNRGSWEMAGIPYMVNKSTLYRINSDFTKTSLGSIGGSGRVSMATNGTQLMILDPGGNGYIYSVAGGLVTITAAGFRANGNPQFVVFIDSYFACSTDSKKWIISSNNDGTAWSALDVGSAETDPDVIVAPVVVNNQIIIMGSLTGEAFQNVGSTVIQTFPFQRSGLFMDKGCVAPFSLINASGSFFMIGKGRNESPSIYRFLSNNFQKISDPAIDTYINRLDAADVENAFALSYAIEGAHFVSFSFPLTTFVYNLVTEEWHEQKSVVDEVKQRWRVNSIVTAYDTTIVGDSEDGRIGKLDTEVWGEYGNDIIRTISGQVFDDGGQAFNLDMVELTIESGVGNAEYQLIPWDDIVPRTYVIVFGTPTIVADSITFLAEPTKVDCTNYWEVGETYVINCTVSSYVGGANTSFNLPYHPSSSFGDRVSSDGTYEYEYTVSVGSGSVEMSISSTNNPTGTVVINSIKKAADQESVLVSGVEDPECEMTISRDGKTFSANPIVRKMGKRGEFNRRQIWRGLGSFKRFGHLKWRFSDQVKTVVIKAEVE